jgi:hypothetical protein
MITLPGHRSNETCRCHAVLSMGEKQRAPSTTVHGSAWGLFGHAAAGSSLVCEEFLNLSCPRCNSYIGSTIRERGGMCKCKP